MANDIRDAVNLLVETARREFAEPHGNVSHYRFSVTDTALEIMHAVRRPIEWRVIPLDAPAKIEVEG